MTCEIILITYQHNQSPFLLEILCLIRAVILARLCFISVVNLTSIAVALAASAVRSTLAFEMLWQLSSYNPVKSDVCF
jgi:hypothetical protein